MTQTIRDICLKALGEAEAAIAAGFKTKRAQQGALGKLSRAYEAARAQIVGDCLSQRNGVFPAQDFPEPYASLYWDLPAQLNHWRPKHAAAVIAAFPDPITHRAAVGYITALVACREAVEAVAVEAKPIITLANCTAGQLDEVAARLHLARTRRELIFAAGCLGNETLKKGLGSAESATFFDGMVAAGLLPENPYWRDRANRKK